jgi:exodeoxyribonuclease VII large subunit
VLDGLRTHLRAAQRGLPRRQDLLALPRQRYDAVERRLGRALLENARAHERRLVRVASRLTPQLLHVRLARARDRLDALGRHAAASLARSTGPRRVRLERVAGRLAPQLVAAPVTRSMERVGLLHARLRQGVRNAIGGRRRHLDSCAKLLASLGYQGVLKRGFALVRDARGASVRSARQVSPGQSLDLEFGDGHVGVQATAGRPEAAAPQPARRDPVRSKVKAGSRDDQGSLF